MFFKTSYGQDTIRRFEFGSTLITINSFNTTNYFPQDRPSCEFVNGLFFRYTHRRIALRVQTSYSDNHSVFSTPSNWSDGASGDIENKDFRIGVGGQLSILKRKDWLYTFADLLYRNVYSSVNFNGGFTGSSEIIHRTSNGLDANVGLGLKLRVLKHVYISPELGYNLSEGFVSASSNSMLNGKSSNYSYTDIMVNPIIKLHLTVKF